MDKTVEDWKTFNVRLPKETWLFLKIFSAEQEMSMNEIIRNFVEKLKKKNEKDVDE